MISVPMVVVGDMIPKSSTCTKIYTYCPESSCFKYNPGSDIVALNPISIKTLLQCSLNIAEAIGRPYKHFQRRTTGGISAAVRPVGRDIYIS